MSVGAVKRDAQGEARALEEYAHELEGRGDDLLAVRQMERALLLRCREGVDEAAVCAAERLVVKCNTVAVKSFKMDDYDTAVPLLENALRLTDEQSQPLCGSFELRVRLRGTTLNNYGCLERRRGRLQLALKYLGASIEFGGHQSPATYLNVSAIQSQLNLHDEAVGSARRAIGLLEQVQDSNGLLAVAHHNLAMALEHVDSAAALSAYETALHLAIKCFGSNSSTTQTIEKSLQRFNQKSRLVRPGALPPIQPHDRPQTTPVHPFSVSKRMTQEASVPRSRLRDKVPEPPVMQKRVSPVKKKIAPPPTQPHVLRSSPSAEAVAPSVAKPETEGRDASVRRPQPPQESKGADAPGTSKRAPRRQGKERQEAAEPSDKAQLPETAVEAEPSAKGEDLVGFMMTRLNVLLSAEEKYEHTIQQVVRIQVAFRKYTSRKKMLRRRADRLRQAKLEEISIKSAARKVQEFLRKVVLLSKMRTAAAVARSLDQELRSASAVKIQKSARRWLAQRMTSSMRSLKKRSLHAATKIQCWTRSILAKRKLSSLRCVAGAVSLTAAGFERHSRAATTIQRCFRAACARYQTRERRGAANAVREKERGSRMTASSVVIQAWWRGIAARRRCARLAAARLMMRRRLRDGESRRCAAIVLQGFARGIIARRVTDPLLQRARAAQAQLRSQFAAQHATRIQSWVRGWMVRLRASCRKHAALAQRAAKRHDWVLRLLQRYGRGYRVRCALFRQFDDECSRYAEPVRIVNAEPAASAEPAANAEPAAAAEPPIAVVESKPRTEAHAPPALPVDVNSDMLEDPALADTANAETPPSQVTEAVSVEGAADGGDVGVGTSDGTTATDTEEHHPSLSVGQRAAEDVLDRVTVQEACAASAEHSGVENIKTPTSGQSPNGGIQAAASVTGCACDDDSVVLKEHLLEVPAPYLLPSVKHEFVRQYKAVHVAAGSVITRIARGFLGRLYAKQVRELVKAYIDEAVAAHRDSPSKSSGRQLTFSLLNSWASHPDVIEKSKTLCVHPCEEAAARPPTAVQEAEAVRIQRCCRQWLAVRRVRRLREDRRRIWEAQVAEHLAVAAVVVLQRTARRMLARARVAARREERRQQWEAKRAAAESETI